MALVPEDGSGLADADSYVSVDSADTYHDALGNANWAALDTAVKEAALRRATQYVDTAYSFRGVRRRGDDQALEWPRNLGLTWPIMRLKSATCELALRATDGTLYEDQTSGAVTRETMGPITVEYAANGLGGQTRYAVADSLLAPYTGGGRMSLRLERAE